MDRPGPNRGGDMLPLVYDLDAVAQEEQSLLAESVAGWSEKYPDVRVERRLVRGHAAGAFVTTARQAQLLVVGSRGRGDSAECCSAR